MNQVKKQLIRIITTVGVLLSVLAGIEVIRIYNVLRDFHPYAGLTFVLAVLLMIIYLLYQIRALFQFPTVPSKPEISEDVELLSRVISSYKKYYHIIIQRLEHNQYISEEYHTQLQQAYLEITELSTTDLSVHDFKEYIDTFEKKYFDPIYKILDEKAASIVSDNVGIITIGTALSPYRALDLYIVLARNFRMVNKIIKIYRTSPSSRETVKIFYDIAKIVAAVNILNASDQVWAGIGRQLPVVGRWGEAAAEGIFSGLFTSVAGHAAIDRCRTYRSWNSEEVVAGYRQKLRRWGQDVIDIMKRHALDRLMFRKRDNMDKTDAAQKSEDLENTADLNKKRYFGMF